MSKATLLAGAMVAAGLVATAALATDTPEDSSLFGASSSGAVVVLTKAKIDGVGKAWARCSSDAADLGVGSFVTSTIESDAVLSFGGWLSQDIKGSDGLVTSTQSLSTSIPIPKLKNRRGKLGNDAEFLVESPFLYDIERFVNGSLVTSTVSTEPGEPWEPGEDPPTFPLAHKRKASKVLLDGAISLHSVKTLGYVKTNRRIAKLKARVTIRFAGFVVSGPHAGRELKGTVKITFKGPVDD